MAVCFVTTAFISFAQPATKAGTQLPPPVITLDSFYNLITCGSTGCPGR